MMSESTELTEPPVLDDHPESAAPAPAPTPGFMVVSATELLHLAQGFYFIFWGILVSVVVGTQLLVTLELPLFAEIFLAGGIGSTLVGTWRLYKAHLKGVEPADAVKAWRSRARFALILALLIGYFCIPFYFWRRVPANVYLMGNALAFLFAGILYMVMLSRTVAALARALGLQDMVADSRLFSAGNIGLLLAPLTAALLYAVVMGVLHRTNPVRELLLLLGQMNRFLVIILLLPFSLTLSLTWAAKDNLLRALTSRDQS